MRLSVLVALALMLTACPRPTASEPPGQGDPPQRRRRVDDSDNLRAFARVYGYVRFFHPTDAAASADWSALAAQGAAHVHDAETVGELARRLEAIFKPLAPELQLWVDGETPPRPRAAPRRREGLVFWQHQGFVGAQISLHRPPYVRTRVGANGTAKRRFAEEPPADATIDAELGAAGLHARLPVVLSTARARAAPAGHEPKGLDPALGRRSRSPDGHADLHVRRGAVIEVWNVLRHFYPYQAEVAPQWPAVLDDALADAEDDASLDDTLVTLRRLVHSLRDGHGFVGHPQRRSPMALPFEATVVEDQMVITASAKPEFAVGDIVERIGDEQAMARVQKFEALLSGSPQWRRFRAAAWEAMAGKAHTSVEVAIVRGDTASTISTTFDRAAPIRAPRPPVVHRYEDGVFYVDLTQPSWPDIEARIDEIAAAPGVVFDMRGYPENTDPVIDHLLTEPESARWMQVPRIVEPDGTIVGWHEIGWDRQPRSPHITGRIAFLISAAAISYAESVLLYVDAHDLGTLVGSPTAGTNGDIVRVDTLGGLYVIFTGMRVIRHDGRPFHLEGVRPDIEVYPTIAGLRGGKDEVLEAGLVAVRKSAPDDAGSGSSSAAR